MISVIPRKTVIVGFHFRKFGCCKPTSLKNIPSQFFIFIIIIIIIIIITFFGSLVHILRISININSKWIAQNILSKEVKGVLQKRGGGTEVAMELLKKTKRAIIKILL